MHPYILWGRGIIVCCLIALLFFCQMIEYIYENKASISNLSRNHLLILASWILLFAYVGILRDNSVGAIIMAIPISFYPVIALILITDKEKRRCLDWFTTFMAVLLLFSLLEYFLLLFGVLKMAPNIIYYPEQESNRYYFNYGLFIIIDDPRNFLLPRFQSIFMEPGHLGMMGCLLLYANGFNLRDKRVVILLISTIVTMSLAAYVLLIIGFFLFIYAKSSKKSLMALRLFFLGFLLIGSGIVYYNLYPDSPFSTAILGRLIPDDKKGIKGNNRNTEEFKKAFGVQMEHFDADFFFGYGVGAQQKKLKNPGGNASAKLFIFEFGIVGLLLLLFFYTAQFIGIYSDVSMGMFFLFIFSFLQRPYAMWFVQIMIMMCGCVEFRIRYPQKITRMQKYLFTLGKL